MKIKFLTGLVFLFTSTMVVGQNLQKGSDSDNGYEAGLVYVKLRGSESRSLETFVADQASSEQLEEIFDILNVVPSDFGIQKIEPTFKLLSERSEKLSRIYSVRYNRYDLSADLIETMTQSKSVEYAEKGVNCEFMMVPNDPLYATASKRWHLDHVDAEDAWDITAGSSDIVVAVIDDAIEVDHEDLEDNIWNNPGEIGLDGMGNDKRTNGVDDDGNGFVDDFQGWNFAIGTNDPSPISGSGGTTTCHDIGQRTHGTAVSGLVAATTNNNLGLASLGHGLRIMSLKTKTTGSPIIGLCGLAASSAYNNSLEYAIFMGAHVINMSWGSTSPERTRELILNYASSQGIVLVAAAGNDNSTTKFYPAAHHNVIAVGASNSSDQRWSSTTTLGSNYGDWVDIMAPGADVWTTFTSTAVPSDYNYQSGTSLASPMVAALCGMLLSINPDLSPSEIRECLMASSDQRGSTLGIKQGSGIINAKDALDYVSELRISAGSNFQSLCPGQTIKYVVDQHSGEPITSWSWTFNGGSPATSNAEFPVVTYNTPGVYDVSVTVSDGTNNKSLTLTSYIEVLASSAYSTWSDLEDNNWIFGNHVDMEGTTEDFDEELNSYVSYEASASISNRSGNLLLYTADAAQEYNGSVTTGTNSNNGITLYNRHHVPVKGSETVWGTTELPNSLLLVPKPGFCNDRYYLFSVAEAPLASQYDLFCYEIDMSGDNGLGEVVNTFSLTTNVTGQLTATISCDGSAIYVVAHDASSNGFYVFSVTETYGVLLHQTVSTGASMSNYVGGEITFSPDGSMLAIAMTQIVGGSPAFGLVEIHDFNNATGNISGTPLTIGNVHYSGTNGEAYGLEFSPNSQLLYVSNRTYVYQYDLNAANVPNSRTSIALGGSDYGQLELTPNENLAVVAMGPSSPVVKIITTPNTQGGTHTSYNGTSSLKDGGPNKGLPNVFMASHDMGQYRDAEIIDFCSDESKYIIAPSGSGNTYEWDDQSTSQVRTITQDGIYWVIVSNSSGCQKLYYDVRIHQNNFQNLGWASALEVCDYLYTISPDISPYTDYTYKWREASSSMVISTQAELTVSAAGNYKLEITDLAGVCSDEFDYPVDCSDCMSESNGFTIFQKRSYQDGVDLVPRSSRIYNNQVYTVSEVIDANKIVISVHDLEGEFVDGWEYEHPETNLQAKDLWVGPEGIYVLGNEVSVSPYTTHSIFSLSEFRGYVSSFQLDGTFNWFKALDVDITGAYNAFAPTFDTQGDLDGFVITGTESTATTTIVFDAMVCGIDDNGDQTFYKRLDIDIPCTNCSGDYEELLGYDITEQIDPSYPYHAVLIVSRDNTASTVPGDPRGFTYVMVDKLGNLAYQTLSPVFFESTTTELAPNKILAYMTPQGHPDVVITGNATYDGFMFTADDFYAVGMSRTYSNIQYFIDAHFANGNLVVYDQKKHVDLDLAGNVLNTNLYDDNFGATSNTADLVRNMVDWRSNRGHILNLNNGAAGFTTAVRDGAIKFISTDDVHHTKCDSELANNVVHTDIILGSNTESITERTENYENLNTLLCANNFPLKSNCCDNDQTVDPGQEGCTYYFSFDVDINLNTFQVTGLTNPEPGTTITVGGTSINNDPFDPNSTFTLPTAGDFTVCITQTKDGCTYTYCKCINVECSAGNADFEIIQLSNDQIALNFTGDLSDVSIIDIDWGDNSPHNFFDPDFPVSFAHQYPTTPPNAPPCLPCYYSVCITITYDNGCTKTICKTFEKWDVEMPGFLVKARGNDEHGEQMQESKGGLNTLSTGERAKSRLHLYPNPTKDGCFIHFETAYSTAHLTVFDGNGAEVMNAIDVRTDKDHYVDLSDKAPGVYSITIQLDDKTFVERVVLIN